MDSIDRDILKYMSNRDRYDELKDIINKGLCVKESWEILADFGEYFAQHPQVKDIDNDFIMWQRVQRHPNWKPDEARIKGKLVSTIIGDAPPDRVSFLSSINHLKTVGRLQSITDELSRGAISVDDAFDQVKTYSASSIRGVVEDKTVELDLTTLATNQRKGGFYWRLEDLNRSLGPVRKGDFIVVGKRPEVGGTSFLVSEMTHMLEQTKGNAIIFNNEEAPDKVYSRMVSSALGVGYRTLLGDPAKYQAQYDAWLDGSSFDLVHDTNMTVHSIRRKLEEKEYDIIGINVLLKVGGTGRKEDHDKFEQLGLESRRFASEFGCVLGIVQADPSAEGMPYIPQDRIYKSKTALQGEADGLIMIGTDPDIKDDVRYIHVAKNKLPPAPCTDTKFKHGKSEVHFDVDTGRFSTKNFKGAHSRGNN